MSRVQPKETLMTAALSKSPSHRVCCWDTVLLLRSSCLHLETSGQERQRGRNWGSRKYWNIL